MDSKAKPDWFHLEKFVVGQKFFLDNISAIFFSWYCALLVGFAVPALSESLLFSKATTSPETSRRRYVATLKHLLSWHLTDIFDSESKGHKSLAEVRAMHDRIRKELDAEFPENSGLHLTQNDLAIFQAGFDGESEFPENSENSELHLTQNDLAIVQAGFIGDVEFSANSGLHLTQNDFVIVQAGFIGPVVLYPKKLGIWASTADLAAYVYFWRVIGWSLGIEDNFNCCESLEIAEKFAKRVEQEIIVKNLRELNPKFAKLRSDFAAGLHDVGLILTENSVLAYVFPQMGISEKSPKFFTWNDWKAYLYIWVHSWVLYYCPIYRNYCNQRLLKLIKY